MDKSLFLNAVYFPVIGGFKIMSAICSRSSQPSSGTTVPLLLALPLVKLNLCSSPILLEVTAASNFPNHSREFEMVDV